jgi:lambda family phage portal protein
MAAVRSRKKAVYESTEARYDAAGMGRRIKGWNPPSSGPQRAVEGLQRIRDRARDTTRNDWAGESGIQKWATNLVGFGITPRWTDKKFTKIWKAWCPKADADGVLDAYGMQTLGVRSWLASGEVFLRRRPRDLSLPLHAPVQVQLIESDFCPVFDATTYAGMPAGHVIKQGIEFNRFGRRIAYWMYREHPGDRSISLTPTSTDLIRVSASDISHVFEPSRPGQLRGVSSLAPILVKLRSSMDFEDAVLDRQKLANLFTMFITRQMPPNWADINIDPMTGLPKFYDAKGNILVGLEPGTSQELQPGEDVKFANPPESGTSYPDYMRTTHMGTAAGQGLPYEFFSGDIRDVSDRTLRVVVNEFRRFARQRQWQIVIPMICNPMTRWLAEAAALKGLIRASEVDRMAVPAWSPEGWEYIHPVQDVEGKLKARDGGLTSTSQLISERGDDPEEVLAQIKKDEASGLTPKAPEPTAAAPAAAPAPQPREDVEDVEDRLNLRTLQASFGDLARSVQASMRVEPAPAPAPQPVGLSPEMLTSITAAMVSAMSPILQALVAQAARPITVEAAQIHVPEQLAPIVNVAPPEVHVAAPTVNVAPPEVHVAAPHVSVTNEVQPATVEVVLPSRKTESDITRDREGNIINVVQVEKTIQ